jgi:hypothetical protein
LTGASETDDELEVGPFIPHEGADGAVGKRLHCHVHKWRREKKLKVMKQLIVRVCEDGEDNEWRRKKIRSGGWLTSRQ